MKTSYHRLEWKKVNYRKCKDFSNKKFREFLINELSKITVSKNYGGFETIFGVCRKIVSRFATVAPRKQKYMHLLWIKI